MKLLIAMKPGIGDLYLGATPPMIQGKLATLVGSPPLWLYVLDVEAAFEISEENKP